MHDSIVKNLQAGLCFSSLDKKALISLCLAQLELSCLHAKTIFLWVPNDLLKDFFTREIAHRFGSTFPIQISSFHQAMKEFFLPIDRDKLSSLLPAPLTTLVSDLLLSGQKYQPTALFSAELSEKIEEALTLFPPKSMEVGPHIHIFGLGSIDPVHLALLDQFAKKGGHLCFYIQQYSCFFHESKKDPLLQDPIESLLNGALVPLQKMYLEQFDLIEKIETPNSASFFPLPEEISLFCAPSPLQEVYGFLDHLAKKGGSAACFTPNLELYLPLFFTFFTQEEGAFTVSGAPLFSSTTLKTFFKMIQFHLEEKNRTSLLSLLCTPCLKTQTPYTKAVEFLNLINYRDSFITSIHPFMLQDLFTPWQEIILQIELIERPFDSHLSKDWVISLKERFDTLFNPCSSEERFISTFWRRVLEKFYFYDTLSLKEVFSLLEQILSEKHFLQIGQGEPLFHLLEPTHHNLPDYDYVAFLGLDEKSFPGGERSGLIKIHGQITLTQKRLQGLISALSSCKKELWISYAKGLNGALPSNAMVHLAAHYQKPILELPLYTKQEAQKQLPSIIFHSPSTLSPFQLIRQFFKNPMQIYLSHNYGMRSLYDPKELLGQELDYALYPAEEKKILLSLLDQDRFTIPDQIEKSLPSGALGEKKRKDLERDFWDLKKLCSGLSLFSVHLSPYVSKTLHAKNALYLPSDQFEGEISCFSSRGKLLFNKTSLSSLWSVFGEMLIAHKNGLTSSCFNPEEAKEYPFVIKDDLLNLALEWAERAKKEPLFFHPDLVEAYLKKEDWNEALHSLERKNPFFRTLFTSKESFPLFERLSLFYDAIV